MCLGSRLSDLGEFGFLAELARRGLAEEIGDDTAVLPGGLVVTQDALVQDIHFRLGWTSWRDLGYKAAAVNVSDLAAAGADPAALFVSLAVPPETDPENAFELYEGMREASVPVRGGDMSAGDRVYLSVTAIGHSERVPGRAGAKPGDVLVVTGPLGGSAAGLRALELGREEPAELIRMHLRPPLRVEEGKRLASRGACRDRPLRRARSRRRSHRRAIGLPARAGARAATAGVRESSRSETSRSGRWARTTSCWRQWRRTTRARWDFRSSAGVSQERA